MYMHTLLASFFSASLVIGDSMKLLQLKLILIIYCHKVIGSNNWARQILNSRAVSDLVHDCPVVTSPGRYIFEA